MQPGLTPRLLPCLCPSLSLFLFVILKGDVPAGSPFFSTGQAGGSSIYSRASTALETSAMSAVGSKRATTLP
jgi:hypothetical protein